MYLFDVVSPGIRGRGRGASEWWTTATGERVRIGKMTDSHLLNAIRLVGIVDDKMNANRGRFLYAAAAVSRGEHAIDMIHQEIDAYERDEYEPYEHPLYEALTREAWRRGLKH